MNRRPSAHASGRILLSRRELLAASAAAPLVACRSESALKEPAGGSGAAVTTRGGRTREVKKIVDAQPTVEGAGVRLRRALGSRELSMLDPFLMLDEFHSDRPEDYEKGFPTHPHRGFETVTYMLEGAMEHQDSMGNKGHLGPGTAQWMTAGHGILHSEMPKQERGLMWGFQLWVNLPAASKMIKPRYQDIPSERITIVEQDEARVRLVAGEVGGKVGPVSGIATAPLMIDVALLKRSRFEHAIPASHNAFVYVFEGRARLGDDKTSVTTGQLAVLGPGERVIASSDDGGRFLLFAGRPINEPVARYGPFVMNTDEEIKQAMEDYRTGRLTLGV